MERPTPLEVPNIDVLKKAIEEYFDHLEDEDTCEDTQNDLDDYILESAIEAIYGENASKFIEKCLNDIENRD